MGWWNRYYCAIGQRVHALVAQEEQVFGEETENQIKHADESDWRPSSSAFLWLSHRLLWDFTSMFIQMCVDNQPVCKSLGCISKNMYNCSQSWFLPRHIRCLSGFYRLHAYLTKRVGFCFCLIEKCDASYSQMYVCWLKKCFDLIMKLECVEPLEVSPFGFHAQEALVHAHTNTCTHRTSKWGRSIEKLPVVL